MNYTLQVLPIYICDIQTVNNNNNKTAYVSRREILRHWNKAPVKRNYCTSTFK